MAFVKLDCGMLDSTIWIDREAREVFVTALLMAAPFELRSPTNQIEVRTLNETGFVIPAGWYGFVAAAGTGIARRAGLDSESGLSALERLGAPETESRTPDFEGRRVVRVDGGYLILNFIKYREKDATTADRSKRYRERLKERHASRVTATPSRVIRHQAEAEAEAEDSSPNGEELAHTPSLHRRPTLDQAKASASTMMLTPEEAEKWWLAREGSDWMKGTAGGGSLRVGSNWQADMKGFCNSVRHSAAEKKAKGGTRAQRESEALKDNTGRF